MSTDTQQIFNWQLISNNYHQFHLTAAVRFVLLCWCALYSFAPVYAQTSKHVMIGVSEIPFLLSENPQKQGEYNQLLGDLKQIQPGLATLYVNPGRLDILFESQQVDCLFPGSAINLPNSQNLIESQPVNNITAHVFSIQPFEHISDFESKNIAIRRGFSFGGVRLKLNAQYIELDSEVAALRFLTRGRVSAIIGYDEDVQGAQAAINEGQLILYKSEPVYTASDAFVCHKTDSNIEFVKQVNKVISTSHFASDNKLDGPSVN